MNTKKALFGPAGNSESFKAAGHKLSLEAPKWLADMGLDCYEYQCGNGVNISSDTAHKFGEQAKAHNIALSLHAPYYISLAGIDETKRLNSVRYIMQSLEAAEAMGAKTIVIHAGGAAKIERREAMHLASSTLEVVITEYEKKYKNITLGLETMGKINQLGTLAEIIELCKVDPRFAPVVDFGHLYARSLGEDIKTEDDIKAVFYDISKELGAKYAENLHCHFSKIEYSQKGGEVKHLTFENGVFGPSPDIFAKVVAQLGVTPTVVCESAGTMAEDALYLKTSYLFARKENSNE